MIRLCCTLLMLCALGVQAQDLNGAYTAMRMGDFGRAADLFRDAARAGSTEAQCQLGKLYLNGHGVDKNIVKAQHWLTLAADSEDAQAQYSLGLLLLERDEREAGIRRLQQSASQGNRRARQRLEKITDGSDTTPALNSAQLQAQWWQAAINCNVAELQSLLTAGADINWRDKYQRSALHYLVDCHSEEGVKLALTQDMALDQRDQYRETGTTLAVSTGQANVLHLLLQAGADPAARNHAGDSLLHLAVTQDSGDMIGELLRAGAPPNTLNRAGNTPLDMAELLGNKAAAAQLGRAHAGHSDNWQGSQAAAQSAIATYVATDKGKNRRSPWDLTCQAAVQNQADLLSALLAKYGKKLAVREDEKHRTLLQYATEAAALDAIDTLIAAGAPVDQRNGQGDSALMLVARHGDTATASRLLALGADPAVADARGLDSIHQALATGHDDTARLLLAGVSAIDTPDAAGQTYLMQAISTGAEQSTEYLLAKKARTDLSDEQGHTALTFSAAACNIGALNQIVQRNHDINHADAAGRSALHTAIDRGCEAAAAALLQDGADIDAQTLQGNTPLMLAIKGDHAKITALLLRAGADIDTHNKNGDTALHFAARHSNHPMVAQLLEMGADAYRRNELGESALSLAEQHDPQLARLIKDKTSFRLPGF